MTILKFSDFEIIISRKPIKNINLRISRDGKVHLSAPMKYPIQSIQQFIEQKQTWITTHLNRLAQIPIIQHKYLNPGDLHPFLGQTYPVVVHEYSEQEEIKLEHSSIICYTKTQASLEKKQQLFKTWHRSQMIPLLSELIRTWEPIMDVTVKNWTIKPMKTRWGSCNPVSQKITLNLQLIHEPRDCLEYVLVHEMVHLLEASHNKRFYALMNRFLPNWKICKNQLRYAPIFI